MGCPWRLTHDLEVPTQVVTEGNGSGPDSKWFSSGRVLVFVWKSSGFCLEGFWFSAGPDRSSSPIQFYTLSYVSFGFFLLQSNTSLYRSQIVTVFFIPQRTL